jgi:hypothetical protein
MKPIRGGLLSGAVLLLLAISAGCGGGDHSQTADLSLNPNSCGRHNFPNGNAGEIAALGRTSCTQALEVANQYFSTGQADRPWFCTKLPIGKWSHTTECFIGHYGAPANQSKQGARLSRVERALTGITKAQSQIAPIFLIRP